MKLRNAVFAGVLCLLFCSPALVGLASWGGVALPTWLTADDAVYLSGGIATADPMAAATAEGFASGEFQEEAEAFVGNHVPMKAAALLGSAALQRTAIAASNALFEWDCYPTYYGSDHAYVPFYDAVSAIPNIGNGRLSEIDVFCHRVLTYAGAHPDQKLRFYVVDMAATSEANPAMKYVSDRMSTKALVQRMEKELSGCSNVEVLTNCFSDTANYYENYYRSDHHWNAKGAMTAFRMLTSNDVVFGELDRAGFGKVEGPLYSGAYSRNSLCIVEDVPIDFSYPFDRTKLQGGEVWHNGDAHARYFDASWQNKHWQFYDLFYTSFDRIVNERLIEEGSDAKGILVADSFGGALMRPLSLCYGEIQATTLLHAAGKSDTKLTSLYDGASNPDVIFVGHPGNYLSFSSRNQVFFSE